MALLEDLETLQTPGFTDELNKLVIFPFQNLPTVNLRWRKYLKMKPWFCDAE